MLNLPGMRDIATTGWDSVGVTADGSVVSWGNGGDELGGGNARNGGPVPQPVLDTGGAPGSQLHARSVQGFEQGFDAVLDNGTVAVWGDWTGLWQDPGVTDTQYFPVLIPDSAGKTPISGVTQAVLQLSGQRFLLTSDGKVWAWYGNAPAECRPGAPEATYLPQQVTALGSDNKQIASAGQGAGLFLKQDGSLWSCGNGDAPVGRVIPGGNDPYHDDPNPGQVEGMGPGSVVDVSANLEQALALKTDGTVWAWGRNDNCSVVCTKPDYSDDNTMIDFPVQVPIPPGPPVVSVTACLSASYAIRADGSVLAWGYDGYTSLGFTDPNIVVSPPGSVPFVPMPTVLPMPGNRPVWKIACSNQGGSYEHALALVGDPVAHLADPDQLGIAASVADASVTEGNTAHVTVSLTHPSGLDLTLHYATSDGTAVAGTDYTASSGTVTIPAGSTSATISVPTIGNDVTQPDRAFTVTISDPATSYGTAPWISIGQATARVTIHDDDPAPTVSITGPGQPATEGDTGGTVVPFTVTLNHPSTSTVSVEWDTADGTATTPGDYLPGHGTVTVAPGQTSATVDVVVNGDTIPEPAETFTVTLTDPTGATLAAKATATATIADDDPVVVTAADATIPAPTGTSATATFTIGAHTTIPAGQSVTVPWSAKPGTTPAGRVTGSGTVTLTATHPTASATVTVAAGTYAHTSEFRLALGTPSSSPAGRTVFVRGGTGMITATNTEPGTTSPAPPATSTGAASPTGTAPPTTGSAPSSTTPGTAPTSPAVAPPDTAAPSSPPTPPPPATTIAVAAEQNGTPPRLAYTGINPAIPTTLATLLLLTGLTTMSATSRRRKTRP